MARSAIIHPRHATWRGAPRHDCSVRHGAKRRVMNVTYDLYSLNFYHVFDCEMTEMPVFEHEA
eukprot:UN21831